MNNKEVIFLEDLKVQNINFGIRISKIKDFYRVIIGGLNEEEYAVYYDITPDAIQNIIDLLSKAKEAIINHQIHENIKNTLT